MKPKGRGGPGRGQGRKSGSSPESRLIQRHYRVNAAELEILEIAAFAELKALSRFVTDAALEKAERLVIETPDSRRCNTGQRKNRLTV